MTWSRLLHDPAGFLWEALNTRGLRLTFYALAAAALFPSARSVLLLVLLVTFAVMWGREYSRNRSRKIFYLAGFVALLVVGYLVARTDVRYVDNARIALSPWGDGIARVADGRYTGTGQGFRGTIKLDVEVRDHRIIAIKTLDYPDPISVLDNEVSTFKRQILKSGRLEPPREPGMYRGATVTLTGYTNAVEEALSKGIPGFPRYNLFSRAFLAALVGKAPDRVTLNGLAILFAVFVVFEYTLQSMLTPGTGRAINCYNCASCVGACPVKEAEGVQFPMGLVLLTRLGDYDRVMELSKYCVGCGRCAAKCPIGNSGPLIISAAYQASREKKNRERLQEENA